MDDDGYVNIVGRIKDMIIRGGENVYPREVEEFLLHPPATSPTCRSIGVPDARYGEEIMAWVQLREAGAALTDEELRGVLRRAGSRTTRCPRYVQLVDEFPMTVTGKIQKFKMREATIERLGLEPGLPTA